MVFSDADKAIIRHYYDDKGFNAYQIWKANPEKNWTKNSVSCLIKRYVEFGTMERQKGSGRPVTATSQENQDFVEELICSQEDNPGTHVTPNKIAKILKISDRSVRRMVKSKGIRQFKRLKAPSMNETTRTRRVERAETLYAKFSRNPRMIERAVFQDECDFPLQVPLNNQNNRVYFKGTKIEVPEKNLFHNTDRQSIKVMVSAAFSWYGVTKPIFVNRQGLKVNAKRYHQHLKTELFPAIRKVYPRNDWIYMQDGATSHTANLVQNFLEETIPRRYVKKDEWPPKSPDTNPLDYYFWSRVKEKVYEGRLNKPFVSEDEMIRKIKSVWKECASNLQEIRKAMKQFPGRLQAVHQCNGSSIKMYFA